MEDDTKSDGPCKDIARQLIENEPGRSLNVVMGGGLRSFVSDSDESGRRKDDRNLTTEWLADHPNGEYVTDRDEMMNISSETEHLLGIFATSHMHFNADREPEIEPSLAEMTATALKVLTRNNSNGYILVVEGGKIDLAHHYNNAFRALDDTLALDEAVAVAMQSVGKIAAYGLQIGKLLNLIIFRFIRIVNHRHGRPRVCNCLFGIRYAERLLNSRHGQVFIKRRQKALSVTDLLKRLR